jgi:hypothetical protein
VVLGLPDVAVKKSKDRVSTAPSNFGYKSFMGVAYDDLFSHKFENEVSNLREKSSNDDKRGNLPILILLNQMFALTHTAPSPSNNMCMFSKTTLSPPQI